MEDKQPEQSPVPQQDKNNKIIEYYESIVDRAHREIEWVRSAYKLSISLVAIVFAVGIAFTYKSSSDYKKETKEEAERMKLRLSDDMSNLGIKLKADLSETITQVRKQVEVRIDDEFKEKNIKILVQEKAEQRIDQVADQIILKQIKKRIIPKVLSMEKKFKILNVDLKKARETVNDLKVISDFTMTVIAAQNDDRKAFDKLKSWAVEKSFSRSAEAEQAWIKILDEHASPFYTSGFNVPWAAGIDPSKLSFLELQRTYNSAPTFIRLALVEYIWGRKDILKKERMQFLVDVMKNDGSLKTVEYAGRFFTSESGQNIKPLAIESLLEWWANNKDKINDN